MRSIIPFRPRDMELAMDQVELGARMIGRHRFRLQTLIWLRWMAVAGQSATVLVVAFWLDFPFPVLLCFALIACAAWLNILLALRYPAAHRLEPRAALAVLSFDILQLAGLLFMTGGLANPFSVLICAPVIISSAWQPPRHTVLVFLLAAASVTLLAFFHLPLPWYEGVILETPFLLIAGMWIAVLATMAFTAVYAFRVSAEASQLADALAATELTLQREQHLSALDGLAAATAHELGTPLATITVVAKEMERSLGQDERFSEDVQLLRSQSERCRQILKRLSTLASEEEAHMRRLPLSSLIEEVVAPHREFGVAIEVRIEGEGPEPVGRRNAGILHGLGNLVENAVDFARERVELLVVHDPKWVTITIADDGPGFPPDILSKIGDPYVTRRLRGQGSSAGGLGLGLFIAKTLLERTGAMLSFGNREPPRSGAVVTVSWPRINLDNASRETVDPEAPKAQMQAE